MALCYYQIFQCENHNFKISKETKKFTISFKVILVSWLEKCHRPTVRQYVVNGQPLYYNLLLPSLSSSTFSHWYFSHNLFHQDWKGDEEEEEKFVTKDDAKILKTKKSFIILFQNFTSCYNFAFCRFSENLQIIFFILEYMCLWQYWRTIQMDCFTYGIIKYKIHITTKTKKQ